MESEPLASAQRPSIHPPPCPWQGGRARAPSSVAEAQASPAASATDADFPAALTPSGFGKTK
eukprot:3232432-Karenia_brevis.AAC.1